MHKNMRSCLLILFAILFFYNNGFSQQKKQPKFGKIDMKQLKKTTHEKFPNAHAVVLFDYGYSDFEYFKSSGLKATFERHVAIQFLDKEAFDEATFEIPIYNYGGVTDRVTGIKGITYNLDDKGKYSQTKLNKKEIFSEKANKYWTNKKFTLPNVKEGSIIEIKYSVSSERFWSMKPWTFQNFIPTLYSQYEISVPDFFTFNKNFTGTLAPEIIPSTKRNRNGFDNQLEGWIMKDIPAFKEEDYMRSYINYISRIAFELYSISFPGQGVTTYLKTWNQVGENMAKASGFGGQIKKGGFIKDELKSIKSKSASKEEEMTNIYEFVKTNMRWNQRNGKYSNGIKKAFKEKSGSAADINLLLIAALKEAGFNANPIVLSTRQNGMLPISYPSENVLNYVIAGVNLNGKLMLMDATEDEFPLGLLPVRCFNGDAVIVERKTAKTIKIEPKHKYKSVIQNVMEVSPDGTMTGTIQTSKTGYAALNFRRELEVAGGKEKFIKQMEDENEGMTVNSHEFENLTDIYKPIKEEYDVTIEDKVEVTDKLIYLNPMLYEGLTENPFKLEKRAYPVDFAIPSEEIYLLQIKIPEGYIIESMPQKALVTLPEKACVYTYSAVKTGDKITVTSRFKVKKTIYTETEYEFLKEFYNLMIQKHGEQIVLKKG